jgi:hypothetical protein
MSRKENMQLLQKLQVAVKKCNVLFNKETITDKHKHITAEKGLFAFHTIKHNHSFRSIDCTSSVIRRQLKEKFSSGRTKRESTLVKVLAPFAMQQIFEELESVTYNMNLFILQI